ncbi:MAG: ATP-dependent zinc metalloprotease FtsH [Clostridiales bacterium]|nr:ATP-dependent zinc metalloprotease FtsH [Clostridiales bacterium]
MERRKSRGILLLLVLLAVVLVSYAMSSSARAGDIPYSQLRQYLTEQQVKTLSVRDTRLTGQLQDGTMFTCQLYSYDTFYDDFGGLIAQQVDAGILESYDCQPGSSTNWLQTLLPYVLAFLAFILLMNIMARMNGGAGGPVNDKMARFGEARIQDIPSDGKKVTFKDVAGADEEKEELEEIVQFLRDPERYTKLGAHIPKGVLLVGPPGTGKTLLAKAVAGEADVSFLSISGSDFVEMYVGVGASRVRDLFEQAKHQSPAIVFIDEIDAVGRQRGSGLGGGHDEREQTLNQLLVEMDGFTANEGVVVLAATNRVDILDPALLRPGRFDRQVFVGLPDIKGRRDILAIHAKGKPLAEDVDLARVARATAGFTGADLENLLNEAALLTGRRGEKLITEDAIHQSVIKVIAGPEKHSRVIPEQERRLTAYHEAGHAVVIHALPHHDPVHQITIVPRGQSGGMTIFLPEEDRSYRSKSFMTEQIVSLLGGRAAEEMMLGDISTGASSDIQRATAIARKMVGTYGMSEKLGNVAFDAGTDEVFIGKSMGHTRPYSEQTAAAMDTEIRAIIDSAYDRCRTILAESKPQLEAVAAYLLEHETMDAEVFESYFPPKTPEE